GLNTDIEKTTEKLKARMKVMYEYGSTSYLEILMEAKGFSDLFTRIAAVQAIVRHDNSIIDKYAAQIEELEAAKLVVETEKAEQVEAKGLLTEQQDKLEVLRNEKSKVISELNKDIAALEAAEKQKEKDANALQAEINKALSSKSASNVVYRGNGKFAWPSASSTRITSNFGYRIHPIFGTKKLHRGLDIGAAAGTNVLAAESGVVLTAGYNSSYGYYITINHGSGYVTLYAHNSKLLVKSGDTVSRGQVIAKCGSTGNSTGPHIHFEVQVNGKLVNPLNYL
ncbi:MAG: M23 family metallopeptidase, partial [Clostridia bacterium]|nr:M23 family metallopeptidase [Clostridia bacterium]